MSEGDKENPVTEKVVGPLVYRIVVASLMLMAGFVTLGLKLLAKLWGVDKSAERGNVTGRRQRQVQEEPPLEDEYLEEEWEPDSLAD